MEHGSGEKLKCDQCGMETPSSVYLTRHMRERHGPGREKLELHCKVPGCGYKTIRKYMLKSHMEVKHDDNDERPPVEKKHLCTECGNSYSHKSGLSFHMR